MPRARSFSRAVHFQTYQASLGNPTKSLKLRHLLTSISVHVAVLTRWLISIPMFCPSPPQEDKREGRSFHVLFKCTCICASLAALWWHLSPSIGRILEESRETAQFYGAPVLLNICAHWSAEYLTHVMPIHCVVTIPEHGYCPVV